jgi:hypothetical protein
VMLATMHFPSTAGTWALQMSGDMTMTETIARWRI